jgi:hypothetical protein
LIDSGFFSAGKTFPEEWIILNGNVRREDFVLLFDEVVEVFGEDCPECASGNRSELSVEGASSATGFVIAVSCVIEVLSGFVLINRFPCGLNVGWGLSIDLVKDSTEGSQGVGSFSGSGPFGKGSGNGGDFFNRMKCVFVDLFGQVGESGPLNAALWVLRVEGFEKLAVFGGVFSHSVEGIEEGFELFLNTGLSGNGFDTGGFEVSGEDGEFNGLGFGALLFEVVGNEFEFDAVSWSEGVVE